MIYTDTLFIVLFLPFWGIVAALRSRPALREWLIVGFSLVFVGSWGLFSLGLLLAVAVINFAVVRIASSRCPRHQHRLIAGAIVFDLGVLAVFKYGHFIGVNVAILADLNFDLPALGIPLAISFYTFHLISYLVDFGAGRTKPLRLRQYLFYLCFFPHVVAGPIVRTWQLAPQLGRSRYVRNDFAFAVHFLVVGFFLKAVVANNLADALDPIWDGTQSWSLTAADRWLAAFLYYCQIYSDFAGYTLIALGIARLLGYRLPPNFRGPMLASTLQEFWRRWHRTLSFWLRDYLYIPLGGNRQGPARAVFNLFVTMVLGGLWHGAGWNFLIWGAMHGLGLGGERLLGLNNSRTLAGLRWTWWVCTQLWVTLAWVFFRAPDLRFATGFIEGMFNLTPTGAMAVHGTLLLPLLIALCAVLHQATTLWIRRVPRANLGVFLGLITSCLLVADITVYSPHKVFIYFAF